MPAKDNLIVTSDITVNAREVDFVTRFAKNWDALRQVMGIMRPIRKAAGTKLVSYESKIKGNLNGGSSYLSRQLLSTVLRLLSKRQTRLFLTSCSLAYLQDSMLFLTQDHLHRRPHHFRWHLQWLRVLSLTSLTRCAEPLPR